MACLDSGIDMKFLFGAVSCFLMKDGVLSMTPSVNESLIKGIFVFVFNNTKGEVIASHTEGLFTTEQFNDALVLCRNEVKNVFNFFKKKLLSTE